MGRFWQPCRICGKTHENPQSSSICPSCGRAEAERNANERAEREAYEISLQDYARSRRMASIPEGAMEAYWDMEQNFNHETVADFMIAMLEAKA